MEALIDIQKNLNAPKNQRNNFGQYNYRSCEDILAAVKPLLESNTCFLTLADDIVQIGDRIYIKATATISDGKSSVSVSGYAREPQAKKGMDDSQITGAASSYARKYALNGLFAIDDTKDADATNTHGKESGQEKKAERKRTLSQYKQDASAQKTVAALEGWYKRNEQAIQADLSQEQVQDLLADLKKLKEQMSPKTVTCPEGNGNVQVSYCDTECKKRNECKAFNK